MIAAVPVKVSLFYNRKMVFEYDEMVDIEISTSTPNGRAKGAALQFLKNGIGPVNGRCHFGAGYLGEIGLSSAMPTDIDELCRINVEIGDLEAGGEKDELDKLVAPKLAFKRAGIDIDNREEFLRKVAKSGKRTTVIEFSSFAWRSSDRYVHCINRRR